MEINGKTRTCGLIGCPVEHTLSPVIHNTLAAQMGHDLVYVPFPVEQGRLREAVQGADALQLPGLNVTVPYKSEVIGCLQEIDALAQTIGAVNTLVRTAGGYKGLERPSWTTIRRWESIIRSVSGTAAPLAIQRLPDRKSVV